jgi:hypothetical protein
VGGPVNPCKATHGSHDATIHIFVGRSTFRLSYLNMTDIATMDSPCIDVSLGPTLVAFSSEEEDALSGSWIDEEDLIPLPTSSSQEGDSDDVVMTCNRILFDLIPPLSDCDSLLQDQDDVPMLDYTSSSDEEYDISLDNTSMDGFDDIMDFTCVAAATGDDVSLPLADRFESTIRNLKESMKRSNETRNCLTMKACPAVIDTPDSVTSVIRRVQESTRFIQKSLYHSNKKIVAV